MLNRRYQKFVSYWVTVHLKASGREPGMSISGAVREQTRTYLRLYPSRQLLPNGRSVLIDDGAVIPVENIDWLQPHSETPAAFQQADRPVVVAAAPEAESA